MIHKVTFVNISIHSNLYIPIMSAAPTWIVAFQREFVDLFKDLSGRVAALEVAAKTKTDLAAVKAIPEEVDALSNVHTLTDSCGHDI